MASLKIENLEMSHQDEMQNNDDRDTGQVDEKVVASTEETIKKEDANEIEGAIAEHVDPDDPIKPTEDNVVATDEGRAVVDDKEAGEFVVGKLFVASLSVKTTHVSLKCFYAQFGEVVDCQVATDRMTGQTRCFGFVTFSSNEGLDKAMDALPHEIDGRTVDVKRAVRPGAKVVPSNRLFLGGLRAEHSKEILSDYFGKFGTVAKVDLAMNTATGLPRGFGFVFFENCDAVKECLKNPIHIIANVECRVKKALEKHQMDRTYQGRNFYGQYPNVRGGYGTPGFRSVSRSGWNGVGRNAGPYDRYPGRRSLPVNYQGWPPGDPVSFFGTGYPSPVGWSNRFVQSPQVQQNLGWGSVSSPLQAPAIPCSTSPMPIFYMDFDSEKAGQGGTSAPSGGV